MVGAFFEGVWNQKKISVGSDVWKPCIYQAFTNDSNNNYIVSLNIVLTRYNLNVHSQLYFQCANKFKEESWKHEKSSDNSLWSIGISRVSQCWRHLVYGLCDMAVAISQTANGISDQHPIDHFHCCSCSR